MRELIEIIKVSYEQLPVLPGNYKNLTELLDAVNKILDSESQEQIDEDSLCEVLHENYTMTINRDYKSGDATFSVIRIAPILSDEIKSSLRKEISTVMLSKMENFKGWFDRAQIGPTLANAGINYKDFGFLKLTELLQAVFDDNYRCEQNIDPDRPNMIFIHLNVELFAEENTIPFEKTDLVPKVEKTLPPKKKAFVTKSKKLTAFDKLMSFAVFPSKGSTKGFDYAIRQLAEDKALEENWYYGSPENNYRDYPILRNYLLLTFERLLAEDEEHENDPKWKKKILTTEKNAVFNTGLVDKLYEPVYALFNKNINEKSDRKWVFWTFVKSNDREHQFLTRTFGTNLPAPAHYYNATSELVYSIERKIGSYNWDHFIDNCYRFPIEFLRDNGPDDFDYDQEKTRQFYRRLAEAIKSNPRSMNRIKNRIMDAINYAIKRVRWNFKTAIPIYYPGQKDISLLLPLALVDEKIDVALVLEATDSDAYIAHTILTLQMAYTNARLITRPDSDWLTAERIVVTDE